MALTLTTSRSRSPRLYPVNSPKGPSAVRAPGWISASMIISAWAGTSTSEVSHLTSSSGSRSSPPMMARSSSSMEPMASAPSAMAGCTPMAKPTGRGRPRDSAMRWNCAYNRLMIKGRDTTSIHLTLGKHLWEFQRIAESLGRPLPVGFAIGVHPAIALGALAIGSIDEDERAIMGGLLREPLELVKCETSDVLVPAHAEMIIEAEIQPGARTAEGPFGEFTGYSLGEREREVVKVKAITHRAGAYFQDITVAHLDHMLLSTIPMEANLYRAVRAMVPSVKAVRVPGPFTCYVSLEQRLPGQAKNAILSVLGADMYMKRVVVVDHDVDIFDDRQVTWALATRCQPDRDITIVTHARGSDLDPSTKEDGYSAKWGVDATAKPSLGAYTPRHRVPPETWRRIDLKEYGFKDLGRP